MLFKIKQKKRKSGKKIVSNEGVQYSTQKPVKTSTGVKLFMEAEP